MAKVSSSDINYGIAIIIIFLIMASLAAFTLLRHLASRSTPDPDDSDAGVHMVDRADSRSADRIRQKTESDRERQ